MEEEMVIPAAVATAVAQGGAGRGADSGGEPSRAAIGRAGRAIAHRDATHGGERKGGGGERRPDREVNGREREDGREANERGRRGKKNSKNERMQETNSIHTPAHTHVTSDLEWTRHAHP